MVTRNSTLALTVMVALTATAAVRAAEMTPKSASSASAPLVTISAHADAPSCDGGLPRDEARRLAQNAQRVGAHLKAAECFRVAGDFARANRAEVRASADEGAASLQKLKADAEIAKAQVKRLREARR